MTDLQDLIIRHEGLELKLYTDTVGKISIGVGRNLSDNGISKDEAMVLLNNDLFTAIAAAKAVYPAYGLLTRPRQLALVSLAFNLGQTRLSGFTKMLTAMNVEDYDTAAWELLDSKAARQLPTRYQELAAMLRDVPTQV